MEKAGFGKTPPTDLRRLCLSCTAVPPQPATQTWLLGRPQGPWTGQWHESTDNTVTRMQSLENISTAARICKAGTWSWTAELLGWGRSESDIQLILITACHGGKMAPVLSVLVEVCSKSKDLPWEVSPGWPMGGRQLQPSRWMKW